MKNIFLIFAVSLLAACNDAPSGDKVETGEKEAAASAEGTSYAIDANASSITWAGSKPTGTHTGNLTIKDGTLAVKDGSITGGNFTIDVASITDTDLVADTASKNKLEGHLKSPDFFDVAKFPTAKFEITAIEPFKADTVGNKDVVMKNATHTIKGNLTLKDSTKNVTFPAAVSISDATVTADADFNIDRTEWGLNYKGPKNPADWVIRKEVNLKLKISASKK